MSAFQGVRIIDFSQGVAGPMASMLLGDFEADVVKIEPPAGDRLKAHPGYHAWNRNKTVVTLDLEAADGLAVARDLIAKADVALFDLPPDVLERLELDPATLLAAHPDLIVVSMPPYGVSGPWTGLAPHHSLLTALSGDAFRQGATGDAPVHMVIPYLWYGQAVIGAAAIGAALYERSQSGLGQAVTVSGLHGSAVMSLQMRVSQEPRLPRTDPQGAAPNYRLYQCADGHWLFLGTLFAGFFDIAMAVLGLTLSFDDLVEDPEGSRDAIAAVVRTQSREDWLRGAEGGGRAVRAGRDPRDLVRERCGRAKRAQGHAGSSRAWPDHLSGPAGEALADPRIGPRAPATRVAAAMAAPRSTAAPAA